MGDHAVRELERRFRATGAPGDEAAWLAARARAGKLSRERLLLAAYVRHPPAVEAAREVVDTNSLRREDRAALERKSPETLRFADAVGLLQLREDPDLASWALELARWGQEAAVRCGLAATRLVRPGIRGDPYVRVFELVERWVERPDERPRLSDEARATHTPVHREVPRAELAAAQLRVALYGKVRPMVAGAIHCAAAAVFLGTGAEDETYVDPPSTGVVSYEPWLAHARGRRVEEVVLEAIRAEVMPWALA